MVSGEMLSLGRNATALPPLWSTTAAAGSGKSDSGSAILRADARTIGLIEAIFADDCVFHPTPENYVMIVAFCIIFCLSVVGNSVVVVVILQQRSMRSVTNLYLLNLALSDLLLSVVCMPPTLVSSLVYCWVFGDLLCKLLAYLQPVVVTASAYTLAAIALERYYAIVRPLHSRVWHTKSHALLVIGLVWLISIIANLFMLFMYELRTYNRNGLNCAPKYDASVHFAYQIYMTVALLIVPSVIMTGLYGSVIRTLRSGIKMDIAAVDASNYESNELLSKVSSVVKSTLQSTYQHDVADLLSQQASNRSKLNYGSYTVGGRAAGALPHTPLRQFSTETPLTKGTAAAAARITFDGNKNANNTTNNKQVAADDNNDNGKLETANKLTRASWSSVISMRYRRSNAANFSFLPRGKMVSATRVMLPAASPYSGHSSVDEGRVASAGTTGTTELGARSIRSTHSGRAALVKQRLIRMLIVIVIIFFCCWTPSYIWWLLLNAQDLFGTFNVWNSKLNTFITVLTYLSSCTNPITYCFLNSKFRNALFLSFGCKQFSRNTAIFAHIQRVYRGGGVQNGVISRSARSFRYAMPRGTLRNAVSTEREFSSNINNDNYGSVVDPPVVPSPASPSPTLNGGAASTPSSARPAASELDASLLLHEGLTRVRPHSLG